MAERTHFYSVEKPECDLICQSYHAINDSLYFCEHFRILGGIPTGDYMTPITHLQGICVNKQPKLMEEML